MPEALHQGCAPFSPHFFADAHRLALGDSDVRLMQWGIDIPFKFLDGNLAGLADVSATCW